MILFAVIGTLLVTAGPAQASTTTGSTWNVYVSLWSGWQRYDVASYDLPVFHSGLHDYAGLSCGTIDLYTGFDIKGAGSENALWFNYEHYSECLSVDSELL